MSDAKGTSGIPQAHDRAARRLLGHPEVVADLLRGFAPEGPLREFDPDSLSPRPDDRVDEYFGRHQSDLTWDLRLPGRERAVLIIEAQSTVDRTMAARMAVQTALQCEHHLRTTPSEPLPGVLPLVFYTGRVRWRSARSLGESSYPQPASLLTYFAPQCYFLVEARRMPPESLPERNRVSLIIAMLKSETSAELMDALHSEQAWLAEEDAGLWRDYIAWAARVLVPLEFPDMEVEQLQSLQEGIDMINEGVVRELEESRRKGLAEGLAAGMARGLAGQRNLLLRQIVWKFGDATAERCADKLSGTGDNGRMEELGKLILDCRTSEEFLAKL